MNTVLNLRAKQYQAVNRGTSKVIDGLNLKI